MSSWKPGKMATTWKLVKLPLANERQIETEEKTVRKIVKQNLFIFFLLL